MIKNSPLIVLFVLCFFTILISDVIDIGFLLAQYEARKIIPEYALLLRYTGNILGGVFFALYAFWLSRFYQAKKSLPQIVSPMYLLGMALLLEFSVALFVPNEGIVVDLFSKMRSDLNFLAKEFYEFFSVRMKIASPGGTYQSRLQATQSFKEHLYPLFSSLLMAPLVEEYVFRKVILRILGKRFGWVVGIVLSSLVFGLVHPNGAQAASAFILGIVIGLCYILSGFQLWVPMLLHFWSNFLAYMMDLAELAEQNKLPHGFPFSIETTKMVSNFLYLGIMLFAVIASLSFVAQIFWKRGRRSLATQKANQ